MSESRKVLVVKKDGNVLGVFSTLAKAAAYCLPAGGVIYVSAFIVDDPPELPGVEIDTSKHGFSVEEK